MYLKTLFSFFIIVFSLYSNLYSQVKFNESNWPGFRGHFATGIAKSATTPFTWDLDEGKNIKWKIGVPGLAHSSPVIWGDRIFLTTAISGIENPELKVGLYGDVEPVEDETIHTWKVYCFDKSTGKEIWQHTAHTGIPKVKRHPKSTHANSTPATDGRYLIAFFGSEGLYCYDLNGKLIWKKDLGILDSGFFIAPEAQWGFASSPVIYKNSVIVQCDIQEESFIASFDLGTGEQIWRTVRNEVPTWSTPTIHTHEGKTQIIVNGYKHIGGYDFESGSEIWKMTGGGDIPVPTPVVAHDLIFINNAHGKMSPIYAIKIDAEGDISLNEQATSNKYIVWSIKRGGSYMLSPLVYGDYLYNCRMNGSLRCFEARNGRLIYKQSIGSRGYSASAVASNGMIYFTSEEGEVVVIKPGSEFQIIARNKMNDVCMATPAISDNIIYFRTQHYLVAVGED
jgi:outer membrane protein assembly factor BamB